MEEKEFMEMRAQIALLKEKLNQQDIVNDSLIRASMRDKQQAINRQGRVVIFCSILAILLWIMIYVQSNMGSQHGIGISLGLCIATCLMLVFCCVATWYCHRPINQANLYSDDVKSVAQAFDSVKRMYHIWITRFAPALLIPWLLWVCHDYAIYLDGISIWAVYVIVFGAAVIGFFIGYSRHRRVVDACQEIIDQLS